MQVVILAAGLGTRLRPKTETVPKQLLEVAGKPVMEHCLKSLPKEISEIIIIVEYLKEKIIEQFGNEWQGKPITYIEQPDISGTANALWAAKDKLTGKFLVLNGDDIYDQASLEKLIHHDLGILVMETKKPVGRSMIEDGDHYFQGLEKNQPAEEVKLLNTGAYILDERFFDYNPVQIPGSKEFGLPDTLVKIAEDHKIYLERTGFWLPVGTPEQLEAADKILLSGRG